MNFVFTEKKMSPSDDLRAYAQKKISKLDKLFAAKAPPTSPSPWSATATSPR